MMKTIIQNAVLMEVIVVKKMHKRDGINTVMNAYVLKSQKQLKLLLIVLINGLVTAIVMIKTTILNVNLMEVIVVKMMLKRAGINIVTIVNVLKCQKQLRLLLNQLSLHLIALINGLVTTSVMIKTTILNVRWMEVIVVKKNL